MAINLSTLRKGKQETPPRITIFSTDGWGKSTLAASAPNPVFFDIEDGLSAIDAQSWRIETWDELMEGIGVLFEGGHEFQTVAIDTLDFLERKIIWPKVIAEYNKTVSGAPAEVITDIPYGKGYMLSIEYWRMLLQAMDDLRSKGMMIIFLAHYKQAKQTPPDMLESYDKYTLDLHDKAAKIVMEWSDVVAFGNFKIQTASVSDKFDKKKKIYKAVGDATRILYLNEKPAWEAKNRYSLPDEIELPPVEHKNEAFPYLLELIKDSFNTTTTEKTNG